MMSDIPELSEIAAEAEEQRQEGQEDSVQECGKDALDLSPDVEAQLRLLFESLPGYTIIATDLDGNIIAYNEGARQIYGYAPEEIIGKQNIGLFFPRESIEAGAVRRIINTLIEKGRCSYEGEKVRKNGERFPAKILFTLIKDKNGKGVGFIEIVEDLTERKRAEEEREKMQAQLLQAQKMEAIGRLTAGIAHDFNNMLLVIQGYTDLLMMKVDETNPLHANLKEIYLTCTSVADLIRKLLLFSRKQPMKLILLNINRTVDDLLKMLNRLIGEDIAVNTDLEPDLWMVRADEGNIEQVIMNLAVNAKDALSMTNGGELTIKTENVTLDEDLCRAIPEARPGKFVCLSVADTGVGMDKETIPHIFEPFFSTKDAGKGTGLGLSVVYGIIQQHGGWINVHSNPGQGSMFKFYLPAFSAIQEDEAEVKETISLQELQGSGERILVVEDEEKVREFVTMALRESGYLVLEAASAEEALELFEREKGKFHMVFSDVVLPGKTGIQLVDQLLARKPELPVLLSSGYVDAKSHWSTIRERGFQFLQKPYALANLLRAIKETMSGYRSSSYST